MRSIPRLEPGDLFLQSSALSNVRDNRQDLMADLIDPPLTATDVRECVLVQGEPKEKAVILPHLTERLLDRLAKAHSLAIFQDGRPVIDLLRAVLERLFLFEQRREG